jgi:aryl-alcohol dehydrogenase-like predicted oxidoreductase
MSTSIDTAAAFAIGGDLPVRRIGYGTMQLTGEGYFGYPEDRDNAVAVLRRAVELGVTLIDTADGYGPFVTDEFIRSALHPYSEDLVIATKVGITRPRAGEWMPVGRPEYLRQQTELNLRNLGIERIDLLQLHRVDPAVPLEDQVGTLAELRREGKVRHIGLSEVTVEQIDEARAIAPIVSVQNLFNLADRGAHSVLAHAERLGIAFIPWFPLAGTGLPDPEGGVAEVAARHRASISQLALAWLLRKSPVVLPIPGTSSMAHLEENVAAAAIELTDQEFQILEKAA